MASITQVISPIPEAGHRGVDSRTAFVTKQEAFQDFLTDNTVNELNTFATQANTVASEVNANATTTQTNKNSVDTNKALVETYKNETLGYRNEVLSYTIPTEATYNTATIDSKINAIAPFSGYMNWKEDNFYFNTSTSFLASIVDTNRYIKFGDKVVDTYGPELVTLTSPDILDTANNSYILDDKLYLDSDNVGATYYFNEAVSGRPTFKVTFKATTIKAIPTVKILINAVEVLPHTYSLGDSQYHTYYFKSPVNNPQNIRFLCGGGNDGQIRYDNISVREIQTKSATDLIPEVTVLDQSTYGLTTQSSVNAGDYVVVDRENNVGTLAGTNWTNNGDGSYSISGNSNTLQESIDPIYTNGSKWVVSFDITSYTSGTVTPRLGGMTTGTAVSGVGSYTQKIIVSSPNDLTQHAITSQSFNGTIDNISVKQVDEVYRAKVDAPAGTLLTDTTYFEVRDNLPISNQIAFLHTMDATTKAYEGITNEILFNDALATETPKAIMLKNGFSEISKGLYSKGSKLYVFAGYWQTLNKGAYHPVFNMAGTSQWERVGGGSGLWYIDGVNQYVNNTATCFITGQTDGTIGVSTISGVVKDGKIGNAAGRPDSKYYDIIYKDQFISFESSELAYKPNSDEKKRIREYEKYRGVEGSVNFFYNDIQKGSTASNTAITLTVSDTSKLSVGDIVTHNLQTNLIISSITNSTSFVVIKADGSLITRLLNGSVTATKTIPFNSKGTSLTTDLIGSPTNYPTIMKDRLAEGKGVFGVNPLLVDDSGVSLVPDGALDSFKVSKKSNTFYNIIRSADSDTSPSSPTWSSTTATSSYITNALTLTNEPTGNIVLVPHISQNNPYQATTPKAVASVEPKVIASNSHSIYKGAIVGNCIGKVQVANGVNGYESKTLENIEDRYEYLSSNTSAVCTQNQTVVKVIAGYLGNGGVAETKYKYVGTTGTVNLTTTTYTNTALWTNIGTININPNHNAITLDTANSPASKWFEGVCYDDDYEYPFVVIEELAYNTGTSSYDGDDDKFTQLTNGTLTDLNGKTVVTKFMVGQPIGRRG